MKTPQGSWDFRDSSVWDDREVNESVGDDLAKFRNRVIGWTTTILTAAFIILLAVGVTF